MLKHYRKRWIYIIKIIYQNSHFNSTQFNDRYAVKQPATSHCMMEKKIERESTFPSNGILFFERVYTQLILNSYSSIICHTSQTDSFRRPVLFSFHLMLFIFFIIICTIIFYYLPLSNESFNLHYGRENVCVRYQRLFCLKLIKWHTNEQTTERWWKIII